MTQTEIVEQLRVSERTIEDNLHSGYSSTEYALRRTIVVCTTAIVQAIMKGK